MKGIIVYDELSLLKNAFFADKLKSELNALGAQCEIVLSNKAKEFLPDFVVMRVYNEELNEHFDRHGVRIFNNSRVASVCNDKWKTYLALCGKFPVAVTQRAEECTLPYPRIVKARHGHGGSQVFWVNDEAEFSLVLANMGDSAIVQPPTGKRGRDLRVYVIGGKPIVAMLRKSDIDFRSNFSLGGSAERYILSECEEKLIADIARQFDFDFAGIDFLLGDGLICNEIEDVVGCRMVYTYTDIDIIKKYAFHIVFAMKTLEKKDAKY